MFVSDDAEKGYSSSRNKLGKRRNRSIFFHEMVSQMWPQEGTEKENTTHS